LLLSATGRGINSRVHPSLRRRTGLGFELTTGSPVSGCFSREGLVMQSFSETPETACLPAVVLLALSDDSIQPFQKTGGFEVPDLQLRLVVPYAEALSDLARVEHIPPLSNGVRRLKPVAASEEGLGDPADLGSIFSVRRMCQDS
jgi:hypothetical protein